MAETKRQSVKKVDGEKMAKGIYEATYSNGTVVTADIRAIWPEFDSAPAMAQRVAIYGWKQKLDDAQALDAGSDVEEYIEELVSTRDAIIAGQWTMRVAGEGVEGGLFARAYAKHHGLALGEAKTKISGLVERNLAANQAKFAGNKEALEKITERAVFNRIRDTALERDAALKAVYDELKAAKGKKKVGPVDMDIVTE